MNFQKSTGLKGRIVVPGDKSISHRAVMFGALAKGTTRITNFLKGADCLSTISCFEKLGIKTEITDGGILVHGNGLFGLKAPTSDLDAGNSGTTTRLIAGILAGQPFDSILTGDSSLTRRPMKRIITPLSMMGANITSLAEKDCLPLSIKGHPQLKSIHYQSPVASAQVKSSILLAGLYADGPVSVTEPALSRNHTELMLQGFGAKIETKETTATIYPEPDLELHPQDIQVPGDISSAAYFIAAALLVPNSELLIEHVGINPTRDGILKVCRQMGSNIELLNVQNKNGEPTADLLVRSSSLKGTVIGGDLIPALIDEIPILAVMACFAEGTTIIKDAQELKVKESNRIDTVVQNLAAMNADIEATEDGMIIRGGRTLCGTSIDSHLDHRIAMAFSIAGLVSEGITTIQNPECVTISYPEFYQDLSRISVS